MSEPGIDLDSLERWDELPKGLTPRSAAMHKGLESLEVRKEHTYDAAGLVAPKSLSAVTYSELIRDIEELREES